MAISFEISDHGTEIVLRALVPMRYVNWEAEKRHPDSLVQVPHPGFDKQVYVLDKLSRFGRHLAGYRDVAEDGAEVAAYEMAWDFTRTEWEIANRFIGLWLGERADAGFPVWNEAALPVEA